MVSKLAHMNIYTYIAGLSNSLNSRGYRHGTVKKKKSQIQLCSSFHFLKNVIPATYKLTSHMYILKSLVHIGNAHVDTEGKGRVGQTENCTGTHHHHV